MSNVPPPSPDYVGPPKWYGKRVNKPIRRIVIHEPQSACERGAARNIARYFKITSRPSSYHYCVDPGEEVQIVWDSYVAYHAPPNSHSLGVAMAGYSRRFWWLKKRNWFKWKKPNQKRVLDRTARLVAQLCLAYDVPPWFRGYRALRKGRQGVTTHAKVSKAWRRTDHWDPGAWPRRRFMRKVRRYYREIQKEYT